MSIKEGDRIKLISMQDDPDPLPSGTTGTVTFISRHQGFTQISVDWDLYTLADGREVKRSLSLVSPPDQFVKIDSNTGE